MIHLDKRTTKALISLRGCAGWFAPVLFENPRRQVFSRRGPNIKRAHPQASDLQMCQQRSLVYFTKKHPYAPERVPRIIAFVLEKLIQLIKCMCGTGGPCGTMNVLWVNQNKMGLHIVLCMSRKHSFLFCKNKHIFAENY